MGRKEEQVRVRKRAASAPREETRETTRSHVRRRRKRRMWIRVLAIVLLVVLAVLLWKNWDTLNPVSVWEWLTLELTGGTRGDGYPYAIEGNNVLQMEAVGRQLALLTDNTLLMVNSSAGETVRRAHAFASPLMDTAGDYVLLGEIGGNRVRIETAYKTECAVTLGGKLVTAAVNNDGSFVAVMEGSGSHLSEVAVYDRKGKEQYRWYSSDLLVLCAALADDGDQMALCGMTAVDGACESRLMVFDVTDAEAEPQRYVVTDELLSGVRYANNNTVVAVGGEQLWIVTPHRQEKQEVSFASQQLLRFAVGNERIATVSMRLGSTAGGTLTVRDEDGEVLYEYAFSDTFRDLNVSGRDVVLLTDRMVYAFDRFGNQESWQVSADGILASPAFGDTAVLGLTEIQRYE